MHKCISFKNCVQFSLHENERGVNTLQLPTRQAHAHVSRSNVFQNNLSFSSSPNSFCQSFVIPGMGEKSLNAKKKTLPDSWQEFRIALVRLKNFEIIFILIRIAVQSAVPQQEQS